MAVKIINKMTIEEMIKIQKQQALEANKQYIKAIKIAIEEIEKFDPKDRLSYANGIERIILALAGSIKGWSKWCTLRSMDMIKEEEYQEIFPKMRELAIKWLSIDIKITETKNKELEEEIHEEATEEKKKTKGKTKNRPSLYVA